MRWRGEGGGKIFGEGVHYSIMGVGIMGVEGAAWVGNGQLKGGATSQKSGSFDGNEPSTYRILPVFLGGAIVRRLQTR
jgi:hypothetical protein